LNTYSTFVGIQDGGWGCVAIEESD